MSTAVLPQDLELLLQKENGIDAVHALRRSVAQARRASAAFGVLHGACKRAGLELPDPRRWLEEFRPPDYSPKEDAALLRIVALLLSGTPSALLYGVHQNIEFSAGGPTVQSAEALDWAQQLSMLFVGTVGGIITQIKIERYARTVNAAYEEAVSQTEAFHEATRKAIERLSDVEGVDPGSIGYWQSLVASYSREVESVTSCELPEELRRLQRISGDEVLADLCKSIEMNAAVEKALAAYEKALTRIVPSQDGSSSTMHPPEVDTSVSKYADHITRAGTPAALGAAVVLGLLRTAGRPPESAWADFKFLQLMLDSTVAKGAIAAVLLGPIMRIMDKQSRVAAAARQTYLDVTAEVAAFDSQLQAKLPEEMGDLAHLREMVAQNLDEVRGHLALAKPTVHLQPAMALA